MTIPCEYPIYKVNWDEALRLGLDHALSVPRLRFREIPKFGGPSFQDGISDNLLLMWDEYLLLLHPQSEGITYNGKGVWARVIVVKKGDAK